jgi:mono/diheme cytochrome c family protein
MALLLPAVLTGITIGARAAAPMSVAAARGAYLAAAAGCDACHTDKKNGGRPYAGGRVLKTSFGTLVTPNITPDRRTGIGGWGIADFDSALRWGIRPDGTHYLPVFPFPFYSRLTAQDVDDLRAYLDGMPAVRQPNRVSRPAAFARLRGAIAVLATPFPGPFRPDPAKDAAWNRGAYLVATLGRCSGCHTPRNWLGAPEASRFLAGAAIGGGEWAPNITPDPQTGIGKWSESDIETLLSDGQKPDFDFVGGAMAEIVRNTTRLDAADRQSIATYLRSLRPVPSHAEGQSHAGGGPRQSD